MTDNYELLRDAYTGGGGFEDGRHLFMHSREETEDYHQRKKMARYSNFLKVIIHSLTNPIFKKTIMRDFDDNEMLKQFVEDVDTCGTTLNAFMKKAAKMARLFGRIFIVVDNFAADEQAVNQKDALEQRLFPYLYPVYPEQVTDYETDRAGRFVSLSYKLTTKRSKHDLLGTGEKEEWTWTETTWSCKTEGTNGQTRTGTHGLGILPIVTLSASDADADTPLPVSGMLHIARASRDVYNRDSEKREILRNQCFPVLIYPATRNAAVSLKQKDEDGEEIGLTLGTSNMLITDGEAQHLPTFTAPPLEPVKVLQEEIKNIIEDMYRQAGLSSIIGVETKTSGVAKQWDFEKTTDELADMAENCEVTEISIFRVFSLWVGIKLRDLKIKYPRTFNITDIEDELSKAAQMKMLAVGGGIVDREINRKAAEVYFADVDDRRYEEIMQDIEQTPQRDERARSEE